MEPNRRGLFQLHYTIYHRVWRLCAGIQRGWGDRGESVFQKSFSLRLARNVYAIHPDFTRVTLSIPETTSNIVTFIFPSITPFAAVIYFVIIVW